MSEFYQIVEDQMAERSAVVRRAAGPQFGLWAAHNAQFKAWRRTTGRSAKVRARLFRLERLHLFWTSDGRRIYPQFAGRANRTGVLFGRRASVALTDDTVRFL